MLNQGNRYSIQINWLGTEVDFDKDTFKISSKGTGSMLFIIYFILSARTLLKLTGKLISTKFIVETILQLKTRVLYKEIGKQLSWHKKTNIRDYNATNEEILYWRFSIRNLNNKLLREYRIPPFFV